MVGSVELRKRPRLSMEILGMIACEQSIQLNGGMVILLWSGVEGECQMIRSASRAVMEIEGNRSKQGITEGRP